MANRHPGNLRKRGKRWTAQFYLGVDPVTGKPQFAARSFPTKGDAVDWLHGQARKKTRGTIQSPGTATVGQLLDAWVAAQERRHELGDLAGTTVDWYRSAVDRHLQPAALSGMLLRDVRAADVEKLYVAKKRSGRLDGKGGLSETSVRRLHTVLMAAFRYAVRQGWLDRNPLDRLEAVPQAARPRADKAWTAAQLQTFLAGIGGHRLELVFRLLAVTGARRSEVLGIAWDDIGEGTVTFRRALVLEKGRPVLRPPKSERSARTVHLDPATAAMLITWKAAQDTMREAIGPEAWAEGGYVFTWEDGRPYRPDYVAREFRRCLDGLDVPRISPHGLRHTAASLMLAAGQPVKAVAEMLGHSGTSITMDVYQSVMPGMGKAAAQVLGEIVNGR